MQNKEVISNKQAISLIILFILGEASIYIQGIPAGKDLWISMILAVAFSLPVVLTFARLNVLYPDKNIFDVIEICFGKYIGKAILIIFILYAFYAVVLVMENLGFYIRTVLFPETPTLAIIAAFLVGCAFAARQGVEALGRWGEIFLIVPIILIITITLLLIPRMDFSNLSPVLYEGTQPIIDATFLTFGFPFTYIAAFTMIFTFSKKRNSPYKIYIRGVLIGAVLLFIVYMLVILVIGVYQASALYYPTYVVVSTIEIGDFLQRLDVISAIIYMIGIYIQTSVFILGTCKGVAKLFHFEDYRFIVFPVIFLALNICSYEVDSIMHYFEFARDTWPYYILPFEVLPIFILLVAEIKIRKTKRQKQKTA